MIGSMPTLRRSFLTSAALAVSSVAAGGVLGVGATGCSKTYIPNTDLSDSEENRKLVDFCESYRHAVERKNVVDLIKLASPDYYEDGGNVDASDDMDYAGLQEYLTNKFQDAKSIRYEIRYRRVTKERDRIFVDYTYSASFRIPTPKGGDQWQRKVDDNRLELVKKDEGFLIVAGM